MDSTKIEYIKKSFAQYQMIIIFLEILMVMKQQLHAFLLMLHIKHLILLLKMIILIFVVENAYFNMN